MEAENTNYIEESFRKEYRMSEYGYIKSIIEGTIGGIVISLIISIIFIAVFNLNPVLTIMFFMVVINGIAIIGYKAKYDEMRLVINEDGIWIFSNNSSWNKGYEDSKEYNGIAWEFIEDAAFNTSFFAESNNSYTILIRGKYRDSNELMIQDVKNGNQAVIFINEYIRNKIKVNNNQIKPLKYETVINHPYH